MNRILSVWFLRLPLQYRKRKSLIAFCKWAYKFSPIVSFDADASGREDLRYLGINLDVSGSNKLFRGEHRLIARMQAALIAQGIKSRICIAPTLGCAWAISRHSDQDAAIISQKDISSSLKSLPVTALRIDQKTEQHLEELNITDVGQLLSLPTKELRKRFDRLLVMRLNQAIGVEQELLATIKFTPAYKKTISFPAPLMQLDALEHHTLALLEELLKQLGEDCQKPARITLEITLVDAPKIYKEICLTVPSSDKSHLCRLLKTRLETLAINAEITSITLQASQTETQKTTADRFIPDTTEKETDSGFAKLLDSLHEQLGEKNVLRSKPKASHIPEKTICYCPVIDQQIKAFKVEHIVQNDRPSLLFPSPNPINAMALLPDAPPFWIKWKNQKYRIISSFGPERIAPEWWGQDQQLCQTRDYFKVQLPSGLWLWIFRELDHNKWYLHGIWA